MTKFYKKWQFYVLVLPLFLFYTVFMMVPVVYDLYYSFTDYQAIGTPRWVGVSNYVRLLGDKYLGTSIINTLKITILMTLIVVPISFFIAYVLNRQTKINNACKVIVFAPYIIPLALSALIWNFILNPSSGLLNSFLEAVGLEGWKQLWINGPTLSPYSFAVVMAWVSMGFYVSLWQVGIRSIDAEVLEASVIDGCGNLQRIRYIVIPLLKNTLISILIFAITGGLKIYEVVFILTGGGPIHKSESIVSYMYQVIFTGMEYGYGMAIAVVESVVAVIITILFMKQSAKSNK